jgi:titin
LATGVTGTSYVDSTCSPGTEYAYEVAGVNGVGTGTYSSAAANFTDPAAPGSLAATPVSGSQINVSWSAPSLGSTVSVVQYTLNRQTNGGSFSSIYTGSTASYSNTGLSAGTTYGYEVDVEAAVNDTSGSGLTGDLTSAFSAVVSASTPGPAAPVPLFGLEGTGACPFGITHPTRRTHIEGVRFQHRNG